ncbi:Ceramide_synthetase [Hexamita inflata]|uniref:Ceramide synthetase n=1 Tax=Hexamita inflata TaxID=28002 RepID=A0AA86Q415_9EUKA|nr:Ceramide synthetase [Hexamita inflata]
MLQVSDSGKLVCVLVPLHIVFRLVFQTVAQKLIKGKNPKKTSESMFFCVQYCILSILGTKLLQQENIWWFHYTDLYREANVDSFTPLHAFYMMGELSVYISAFIFMFFETRKSYADFYMNVIHHVITISIIWSTYSAGYYNYCVIVAQMHDVSDIFLEFSKTVHALGFAQTSKVTFAVFAVTFIVPRVFVLPTYCIIPFWNGFMNKTLAEMFPGVDLLELFSRKDRLVIAGGLSVIYVLNCIWAIAILKMAIGMFKKKEWIDIREQTKTE